MGLLWVLASGSLYVLGALTYASRIPERFLPGKFDFWGQSHQLFHLCVVVAAVLHYKSVIVALNWRLESMNAGC